MEIETKNPIVIIIQIVQIKRNVLEVGNYKSRKIFFNQENSDSCSMLNCIGPHQKIT